MSVKPGAAQFANRTDERYLDRRSSFASCRPEQNPYFRDTLAKINFINSSSDNPLCGGSSIHPITI